MRELRGHHSVAPVSFSVQFYLFVLSLVFPQSGENPHLKKSKERMKKFVSKNRPFNKLFCCFFYHIFLHNFKLQLTFFVFLFSFSLEMNYSEVMVNQTSLAITNWFPIST